jgi:hypothetical protein
MRKMNAVTVSEIVISTDLFEEWLSVFPQRSHS